MNTVLKTQSFHVFIWRRLCLPIGWLRVQSFVSWTGASVEFLVTRFTYVMINAAGSIVGMWANFLSVLQLAVLSASAHEHRMIITRQRSQQEDPALHVRENVFPLLLHEQIKLNLICWVCFYRTLLLSTHRHWDIYKNLRYPDFFSSFFQFPAFPFKAKMKPSIWEYGLPFSLNRVIRNIAFKCWKNDGVWILRKGFPEKETEGFEMYI